MIIIQNVKRTRILSMPIYRNNSLVSQISLEKTNSISKLILFKYVSKDGRASFSLTYHRTSAERNKYKNLPMKVNIIPGNGRNVIGYIVAMDQYGLI